MLELANFSHSTASTILFAERDKMWLVMSWTNHDVITFISRYLFLKRPRVANFARIASKLQPFSLKQPLKTQKKLQELETLY